MGPADTITGWIKGLKEGDPTAARKLWARYFRRLIGLARHKLQGTPTAVADEEDVAQSAFKSLCLGAAQGRFPQLASRKNLWPLLVIITLRKVYKCHAATNATKGTLPLPDEATAEAAFEQILSREPDPAVATQLAEEFQRLLDALGTGPLRSVAVWKMEGYTNPEIAQRLRRTTRSVERKLAMIRGILERELSHEESTGEGPDAAAASPGATD